MQVTLNLDLPRLRKRAHQEIDKISQAADEAGKQASGFQLPNVDIGGTLDSARKAIGEARRSLADGGDQLALGAHQVAGQAGKVGQELRHTVDDLRHLRITRQRGRDPWPGVALVIGVASGVAAMFLFDPRDGARRRALLRDKLGKWGRVASEQARGKAEHVRNVSQGIVHDVRTAIPVGAEKAADESSTELDWPAQEPVGAGVGYESPTPSYADVSHEPGAPNGREF